MTIPRVRSQGRGDLSKNGRVDDPKRWADQDGEPRENGRPDQVGDINHGPGPNQLRHRGLAVEDRQHGQSGLLGEQLRAAENHEDETNRIHVGEEQRNDRPGQHTLNLCFRDCDEKEAEADVKASGKAGEKKTTDRAADGDPPLLDFMLEDLPSRRGFLGLQLHARSLPQVRAHADASSREAVSSFSRFSAVVRQSAG